MSFCPKCGCDLAAAAKAHGQKPPWVGAFLACPTCRTPLMGNGLPFLDVVDLDRVPLRMRERYDEHIAMVERVERQARIDQQLAAARLH